MPAIMSSYHCPMLNPVGALPISISANSRYLVSANGAPFLICADSIWTLEVQLTNAQIDVYLDDRKGRGINAIMFECIEHKFSSQTPAYNNVDGVAPFTSLSPVDFSTPNAAYWQRIDYIVNGCVNRDMVCLMFPAYFGFDGTTEGWVSELDADTAAHLQSYGAFLANRYNRGNVIWLMGGDSVRSSQPADLAQQWNIVTGMRTIRTGDPISAHSNRASHTSWPTWNGFAGYNLTAIYGDAETGMDGLAATEYARPTPFFLIEDGYEGAGSDTLAGVRCSTISTLLSGGCGHVSVYDLLWPLGNNIAPGDGLGPAHALATYLVSTGLQHRCNIFALMRSYKWWLLVPTLSMIASALGASGTLSRICPALASDGSFAMTYKNNTSAMVVSMAVITHASVRTRWWDPTNATFTTVSGSPFTNTGTQSISHPGTNSAGDNDWILVQD